MLVSHFYAEVAELVDALGSGSSVRTDVRVRVSPSAPLTNQGFSSITLGKTLFLFLFSYCYVLLPYAILCYGNGTKMEQRK